MDWSSVSLQELGDALKEAEWSSPPRPLLEFFSRFTLPKSFSGLSSRSKCNLYVYRMNYVVLMFLILVLGSGIARSWAAFGGVVLIILAITCLNDSFALSTNEKITRTARRIYPPFAAKMRAPLTPGGRGRPLKGTIYICGKDRKFIFIGLLSVSMVILFLSSSLKIIAISFALGLFCILLHTSFRTPNLKARLNTFREEFRAVWRSYSDL